MTEGGEKMENTNQVSKLRLARVSRGWSQREVAEKLGITASTLHTWEQRKSIPDVLMAFRLERLYQVPIYELFGDVFNA